MGRTLTIALLASAWGLASCTESEQLIHLQSHSFTPNLLQALAYPAFLEDSQTAETYRQAGLEARQQEDFARAIETLKTAVALAPRTVSGYVILGWTQHLAGQRDEAIATLQKALNRDDEHVPALNALGIAYLVNGDLEQAIATHTQAKTLQVDNEIAYYNLSLAYQRLPDIPAAVEHATRATELEPYNPHPWVALALAHWSQQEDEPAWLAYQQALSLDGRYFDAYHLDHLQKAGFSAEQVQVVDAIRVSFR
ncbi:MAG: tetratricopeptide repeat protein [Cyanobacteria bacterium P01_F01_bin.86]